MKHLGIEIVVWWNQGMSYGASININEQTAGIIAIAVFVASLVSIALIFNVKENK